MSYLNSQIKREGSIEDLEYEKIFIDTCWLNLDEFPLSSYIKYKNIQHIYLEGNKVKKLGENFFQSFPKLKWLDIRNNELDEIPKTVINHPNLQVLLLEGNKLEELPSELGSIPTLRGIQLARNPLSYPPKNVVEKGSTEVIKFLRKEWLSKEKNSNINASLQSCEIKSVKRKPPCSSAQKRKKTNLRYNYGKTTSQLSILRKSSFNLKDCVRVTKLVRPKPKAAVTIFKEWNSSAHNSEESESDEIINHEKVSPTKAVSSKSSDTRSSKREESELLVKQTLLKDMWLKRIRDVLAQQESELQKMRDRNFLSKWQVATKDLQVQKWAEYVQGEAPKLQVPFGTDEAYSKISSRGEIERHEIHSKFKKRPANNNEQIGQMVSSKINALLEMVLQLQKSKSSQPNQQNFSAEIAKITELQRTISSLKSINFTQSVKLP